MARKLADARLQYLNDASSAVLSSSPAAAAHLGAVYNLVSGGDELARPDNARCIGCGTLLVPGATCVKATKTASSKRTRKDRLDDARKGVKKRECSTCGTRAILPSKKVNPLSAKPASTPSKKVHASKPVLAMENRETNNIQPTKRRSRGKKSSLQSIISGHQTATRPSTTASHGIGLSLQDFMKT